MGFIEKDKRTEIEDTIECIEALAKIVKENDLGKLKISTDDIDIVIEGSPCHPPLPHMHHMPPMHHIPPVHEQGAHAPSEEAASAEVCGSIVTSPIVGTFYAAPAPDKAPFVKVGDTVNTGDVVCIIESMKLMNEINCEFSGRVAEIYVSNGDPVEYGQKIMRIE